MKDRKGFPAISGCPIIRKDIKGNILEWTSTEAFSITGSYNVDTGFIPFDGKDFVMRQVAALPKSDNPSKATILNAMDESDSNYNGFCIRMSSASVPRLYSGNSSVTLSDGEVIDITIKKNGAALTIEYNNTSTVISSNYTIDGLTVLLGSSIDNPVNGTYYRYCKGTIEYFSIKKVG